MKQQLDRMDIATGWTTSDSSEILEVDWDHLRASHINGQLQFTLAPGESISKDFLATVSGNTIAFTISKNRFNPGDQLLFRIFSGSDTAEYVVDLENRYRQYRFPNYFTSVTGVELFAVAENAGHISLIVTDLVCFRNEYPADIALAIAAMINEFQPDMPLIGKIKATPAGATSIAVDGDLAYIEKFTVFTVGSETHQVEAINRGTTGFIIVLGKRFDGAAMKVALPAGTEIRLAIPIFTNPRHTEGVTPAISVEGGFDPKKIADMSFREEDLICEDSDGNIYTQKSRGMKMFELTIYGLARSIETEALIREIFGQIQSLQWPIWVNGALLVAEFEAQEENKFDSETESISLSCAVRAGDFSWQAAKILNNQTQTVDPQPGSQVIS